VIAVGVSQRCLPPTGHGERRYALDTRWFGFLAACGITPVPLPNVPGLAVRAANALDLRGLVLTGGDDLAEYGGPFPERDRTERRLLAWAVRRRLPVLGVCRGMQLIARTFGADLVPVARHVTRQHRIDTPDGPRTVNSYHRFGVRAVPSALAVTAQCGDTIEAVRHRDIPVEGIMWHPEREDPPDPRDVLAVSRLFGGAR
jgi:N5-(cytidine 5'-diphosphoramidyl)-L-glutamine hydrolase